ncbi:MAG: SDR family oxidoreductase [Deltaproteobacteria bacterium]|nr:SDR family oxidoreductase [Deltaproteobacteria bacterium]
MSQKLSEKVALVTGGGSGIGAATALELAELGAQVVITGRRADALATIAKQHPRITTFVADVAKTADADGTIEAVRERHGRLDILVNNAGIAPIAPLAHASVEHVRGVLDTNVVGLVALTRAALPLLKASRGNVVNVATTIADQPFANMSIYCASKAAVVALTRAWAQELAADGVRVNVVSPGPIETPLFTPDKLGISEKDLAAMGEGILSLVPLGRMGKAEEVAHVITFLASQSASFVTGAQYTVGGGIEA